MGSFYMESTQINYRRDETLKTVDQKLQELSETSAIDTDIAPVFKSTNTYAPGDMVYYRNKLYVFNVEHTGAWAAADVTATDVTTEITSLKSGLTNVTNIVNAKVNTTPRYLAGNSSIDLTIKGGKAYMLYVFRDSASYNALAYVVGSWEGTPIVYVLCNASNITITSGTDNKVNVANANTGSATCILNEIGNII